MRVCSQYALFVCSLLFACIQLGSVLRGYCCDLLTHTDTRTPTHTHIQDKLISTGVHNVIPKTARGVRANRIPKIDEDERKATLKSQTTTTCQPFLSAVHFVLQTCVIRVLSLALFPISDQRSVYYNGNDGKKLCTSFNFTIVDAQVCTYWWCTYTEHVMMVIHIVCAPTEREHVIPHHRGGQGPIFTF